MSNTKFTPGPWIKSKYKKGQYHVFVPDGTRICTINWFEQYNEEANANADLIAAAPDLYEAAEMCCKFLEDICGVSEQGGLSGQKNGLEQVLYNNCKAALAKARGENQPTL